MKKAANDDQQTVGDYKASLSQEFSGNPYQDVMDVKLSNEGIRLILECTRRERAAKGLHFECYCTYYQTSIIDCADTFCQIKDKLFRPENFPAQGQGNRRIQVIVSSDGHYSTVDFKLTSDKQVYCFLIDSVGTDERLHQLYADLNQDTRINTLYVTCEHQQYNGIQYDPEACGIFATDFAIQVSCIDPYPYLARIAGEEGKICIDDLPPQLFRNANYPRLLEHYKEKHPGWSDVVLPDGTTINKYVRLMEVPILTSTGVKSGSKNVASYDLLTKTWSAMVTPFIAYSSMGELLKITQPGQYAVPEYASIQSPQ